jgi:hypothetical protein
MFTAHGREHETVKRFGKDVVGRKLCGEKILSLLLTTVNY